MGYLCYIFHGVSLSLFLSMLYSKYALSGTQSFIWDWFNMIRYSIDIFRLIPLKNYKTCPQNIKSVLVFCSKVFAYNPHLLYLLSCCYNWNSCIKTRWIIANSVTNVRRKREIVWLLTHIKFNKVFPCCCNSFINLREMWLRCDSVCRYVLCCWTGWM